MDLIIHDFHYPWWGALCTDPLWIPILSKIMYIKEDLKLFSSQVSHITVLYCFLSWLCNEKQSPTAYHFDIPLCRDIGTQITFALNCILLNFHSPSKYKSCIQLCIYDVLLLSKLQALTEPTMCIL